MCTVDETSTNKNIMKFLKEIGSTYCLGQRERYQQRIKDIRQFENFTWREDQCKVIDAFMTQSQYQYFVVNGIFGCGKTTLLLGLLIKSFIYKKYSPTQCMFISFNISIKNEIKRKLKLYGFSSKVKISTFDSIIYKICKLYNYEYLDLPNFDGKRRFVYSVCEKIKHNEISCQPIFEDVKLIFIDEVQDLEIQTFIVFQTFFEDCQIVFAGDVFQSIQKEPRESLLWYLLHENVQHIFKIYMKETPRVPKNILKTLQYTLTKNYPEFEDQIKNWESSNNHSDCDVCWRKFYNYNQTFQIMQEFVDTYDHKDVMILSFSSAITVKGNMGDVARFRKFLQQQGYDLNNNHKKIDPDKIFLSTANSSKGLERDYVLCILSFPLELAFINFSNDIVMNIITVALTRAKKKVIFCVSAYKDKFCKVLDLFDSCPQPEKERIREGKTLSDFSFSDYMNIEHNVTSLIKQSVIRYDTRIKLKESCKMYEFAKISDKFIPRPQLLNEEDRALVGILIENLVTSCWNKSWPTLPNVDVIKNNPMYIHCMKKITQLSKKYTQFKNTNTFTNTIADIQFQGILIYSCLHQAIFNKLFIHLNQHTQSILKQYWIKLKPLCENFKPNTYKNMSIQSNCRMPHLTGISDVMFTNDNDEINIWEMKASIDRNWKDNALTQVILYALMSGKTWSRLTLLNVFSNERLCYYYNTKEIMTLRNYVISDIIIYNTNCYLAKSYNVHNKKILKCQNTVYVEISYDSNNITQMCIIEMLSPTKLFCLENLYFKYDCESTSRKNKLCIYSENDTKDAIKIINKCLEKYKHKKIIMTNKIDVRLNVKQHDIKEFVKEEPVQAMNYEKNEQQKFSCDTTDCLFLCTTKCCYLAGLYKFI